MVGGIDPRVRDRIVAETRGIPLALLEVPRNVSAAELAGGFWNSGGRPSAGQIEEGFVRRIQSLPEPTQRLLLVAAAEPVGDAALFLRAAAQLGIPVDALAPAEAAGVIEFGPRMRFHHPLMRSACYRAADLADRRASIGRWPMRLIRSSTPTVGHGTPPTRQPDPTMRWPRSWRPQPAGLRTGAASLLRRLSWSARRC